MNIPIGPKSPADARARRSWTPTRGATRLCSSTESPTAFRRSTAEGGGPPPPLAPAFTDGSGLVGGSILAVYLHGLAEDPKVLMALVGREAPRPLPQVLDGLADLVDRHLNMDAVLHLAGCGTAP